MITRVLNKFIGFLKTISKEDLKWNIAVKFYQIYISGLYSQEVMHFKEFVYIFHLVAMVTRFHRSADTANHNSSP